MAVGKAGEPADRDRLAIRFGEVAGGRERLGGARATARPTAPRISAAARSRSASMSASGRGEASVWTCDLTKRYVAINADYRS